MSPLKTKKKQPTPSADSLPAAAASSNNYSAVAHQYARDIVSGKIIACLQVRQACQRHLNDLELARLGTFDFVYDETSAHRVCEFIEALPHVKGRWAARREKLKLTPSWTFIVCSLFGWVERADHTRYRFQEAYICVPRKAAK